MTLRAPGQASGDQQVTVPQSLCLDTELHYEFTLFKILCVAFPGKESLQLSQGHDSVNEGRTGQWNHGSVAVIHSLTLFEVSLLDRVRLAA